MSMAGKPIGVFDSGMGGLTVLRALRKALPNESFLYLGDTARLPYGTKSRHTVVQYAKQMGQLLHEKGIKCLVVACNTATTAALFDLQMHFSELPVIGVIEPGAIAATKATQSGNITVLATETTVRSDIYQQTIRTLLPSAKVTSLACGLFVALAEEGCVDNGVTDAAIAHYLSPLTGSKTDTLLLGCTHFPALSAALTRYAGSDIQIVDSAVATAEALSQTLIKNNLISNASSLGSVSYFVTDLPERFCRVSKHFLGSPIAQERVELV